MIPTLSRDPQWQHGYAVPFTGQIDWPAILKAASKVGVKYYFIEDESPTVLDALPQSIKYLESVK